MNIEERRLINQITESLSQILQGKIPAYLDPISSSPVLDSLVRAFNELIESYAEIQSFIFPLSQGVLNVEPPKAKNIMASPFKELHSQLKTLIWQVEQVAKGDYNQRVHFMGDFSKTFNFLVETLDRQRELVKKHINFLELEKVRLQESEERYALAVKHSPGGVCIIDPQTKRILEPNVQLCNMLAYTEQELTDLTFFELYADSKQAASDLANIIQQALFAVNSRKLRKKNGEIIEADVHTCWSLGITNSFIIMNVEDVTEQNKAQQVLNKYRILLEQAQDIIIFCGMDGQILETNKQAERVYGYSSAELQALNISELVSAEEKQELAKYINVARVKGIVYESVHCRKDKSTFPVEISSQLATFGSEKVLVNVIRDISERKKILQELEYLNTHDSLTKVFNRTYLEEAIEKIILAKSSVKNALLIIDIDNFSIINEALGHKLGDQLLVDVAELLRENVREQDILARIGGDEFGILMPDVGLHEAKFLAAKLRQALGKSKINTAKSYLPYRINISVGIAIFDRKVLNAHEVIALASQALFQSKTQGYNRVSWLVPNTKNNLPKVEEIMYFLAEAVEKELFSLHFQPVVDILTGEVIHHEGLLRLNENEDILLYPENFIPLAERFGLMPQIDSQVIKLAFAALEKYPELKLFINLSGLSLGDESLLDGIEKAILRKGLQPSRLGFEITETAAVKDLVTAERWINRLKSIGCYFALDDFGIGYSSFSYLQNLPVDFVKIDGSYIRELDKNSKHRVFIQAMSMLIKSLDKKIIAESVENNTVLKILKENGVNYVQGHYLGKPENVPVYRQKLKVI
ncbi:MAG: EAL domain-containing protein [Peptococcaceae bacterium]|nr:EAL domain-containing protein [Peptococcaceae bacterium]